MHYRLESMLKRSRRQPEKKLRSFDLMLLLMISLLGAAVIGFGFGLVGSDLLEAANRASVADYFSRSILIQAATGVALWYLFATCLIIANGCQTILFKRWFGE